MHQIEIFEVLFLDLVAHLIVFFNNMILSDRLSKESGHEWEQSHLLSLVIENLNLIFPTTDVLKLSPNSRIPYGDCESTSQVHSCVGDQHHSNHQHG